MRNASVKVVEKIKIRILHSITFPPRKSLILGDNLEKYHGAMEAADDDTIQQKRFACLVSKGTDTHSKYVTLIAFPRLQW
jgi:hypothetical protein